MIGYHYTTHETYQLIREIGLQLSILEERHKLEFFEAVEFIEDGCIWVYPEFMRGREQIGMVIYAAVRHDSHHLICLEVDYLERHSVTNLICQKYENDSDVSEVNLYHNLLGAGPFNHTQRRCDLITKSVSPDQIQVVGEWNLLDFVQQRERQLEVVE